MPFPRSDLGERTGAGIVCRDGRRIKGAHRTPGAGHAAARPTYPAELQARESGATKQPEDGDWLMYRRTYDGWGYSPLPQITAENVGKLKPVWTLATGQIEGHQAPPIVNNGVMFVGDTRKSGTGLRRQGRQSSVALQATNSRRRDVFASDQP